MADDAVRALNARLTELGEQVDDWVRADLEAAVQPPAERFGHMLAYHLGWRDEDLRPLDTPAPAGKKLRPGLVLLVCEAVCGSIKPARHAAVAVELVHNFSLVHDDIQDRSETRRHRRTVWSLWGDAQGINAGDALFALAQAVILAEPSERSARMALALNTACLRLVEGQYLDLELQTGGVPLSLELYEAMISRKTGALFECAARLGALAGGADDVQQAAFARFAIELGVAFQEQDDLLGVWGSAAETGKPVADDVRGRKKGLPTALALSRPDAPAWLRALYADPAETEMSEADTARVIQHFEQLGLQGDIEARVARRFASAEQALADAAGREPARSLLAALCGLLVARKS